MVEMLPGRCVYVIEAAGYYKIGKAEDIRKRFSSVKTYCPFECELVHAIYVDRNRLVEKLLHRWLARHRVRGEWFSLAGSQLRILCGLTADYFARDAASPFGPESSIDSDPNCPSRTFPQRLREARKRNKWSLKRVAKRSGYCLQYISYIEKGQRPALKATLEALAKVFGDSLTGDQIMYTTWPD
jgi:hypothetical protein